MGMLADISLQAELLHLSGSLGGILPEFALILGICLGVLFEITLGKKRPNLLAWTALISISAFMAVQVLAWPMADAATSFLGMIVPDRFAAYLKLLIGLGSILAIFSAFNSKKLRDNSKGTGEYYIILMGMVLGMAFMTMSSNLLMMYLSLEMASLPAYLLTAYTKLKSKGAEAALKYVIYGGFASGLMLYGISWLYGLLGTLDLQTIHSSQAIATANPMVMTMMLVLVLSGIAFKVGSLPFHFWMPDVLEGSAHPVASFFSVAPKVAGFGMLLRLLTYLPLAQSPVLYQNIMVVLGILAVGSMLLGNLAALRQQNFRRMLAYSSIAQSGYLLSAVLLWESDGAAVVLFYLTIYLCMNMAAFMLAGWMEEHLGITKIQDMKGLATGLPVLAVLVAVSMISLTGLPPTAGFIAKLRIFLGAFAEYSSLPQTLVILVLVAILVNTVISLFYYLRVPSTMIFGNPILKAWPRFHGLIPWSVAIISIPLIWLGIFSFDHFINWLAEIPPILPK